MPDSGNSRRTDRGRPLKLTTRAGHPWIRQGQGPRTSPSVARGSLGGQGVQTPRCGPAARRRGPAARPGPDTGEPTATWTSPHASQTRRAARPSQGCEAHRKAGASARAGFPKLPGSTQGRELQVNHAPLASPEVRDPGLRRSGRSNRLHARNARKGSGEQPRSPVPQRLQPVATKICPVNSVVFPARSCNSQGREVAAYSRVVDSRWQFTGSTVLATILHV